LSIFIEPSGRSSRWVAGAPSGEAGAVAGWFVSTTSVMERYGKSSTMVEVKPGSEDSNTDE
jgi:hypothetical protein